MKFQSLALALIASATIAACTSMPKTPTMVSNDIVTGNNGMTLYVFDQDVAGSGKSTCNGPCAENWPPLIASDFAKSSEGGSSDLTLVTRDNGKQQWALKGKPLYYWFKDQKPGDKTGDGVKGVWHVAKP
jgi:predicted lipoprotein with Yx(FWY)xxD motif